MGAEKTNELPTGIQASDLKYPDEFPRDLPYDDRCLEFWFVPTFGWCITTLHISNPGRRAPAGTAPRTYAVRVSDGAVVRIGKGPHVKKQLRVWVRPARLKALQKFIDLRRQGAEKAGMIRDRISTRRAQGQLHRMNGETRWFW